LVARRIQCFGKKIFILESISCTPHILCEHTTKGKSRMKISLKMQKVKDYALALAAMVAGVTMGYVIFGLIIYMIWRI